MIKIGSKVVIVARDHPHRGQAGVVIAHATGAPKRVGLEWEIDLDGAYEGGCFVSSDEIRVI